MTTTASIITDTMTPIVPTTTTTSNTVIMPTMKSSYHYEYFFRASSYYYKIPTHVLPEEEEQEKATTSTTTTTTTIVINNNNNNNKIDYDESFVYSAVAYSCAYLLSTFLFFAFHKIRAKTLTRSSTERFNKFSHLLAPISGFIRKKKAHWALMNDDCDPCSDFHALKTP
jgi:hypothetical protein